MKPIVAATLVLFACGCNNAQQGGGGSNCMTLPGGSGCFFPATQAAVRTQCGDVTEYCDTTGALTPNLSCLGGKGPAPGATPAKVTLTGFVHAFSSGPDSNNLTVQVFDASNTSTDPLASQALGSVVAKLDVATQRACDGDGAKGCSIPLANGCQTPTCNDGLMGRTDDRKYCRDLGNGTGECSDRLRWESRYAIDGVPTNTPLVVRVSGPNGASDATWATTVAFNVVLSTNDRACTSLSDTDCLDRSDAANPKDQLNVSALSGADYVNIPTVSGLSGGISSGLGAVAGEVHDCDNVRVGNVEVTTTPTADRYTYFNGNPVKTLPDASRASVGTDRLGLFAALNQKPGKATIETAGATTVGAPLMSFGTFDAFVYPNTVTIVNVNGGKGLK